MILRPFRLPFWLPKCMHHCPSYTEKTLFPKCLVLEYSGSHFLPRVPVTHFLSLIFQILMICDVHYLFVLQANSRKRKPRGKKNKTVKTKVDEVVNSLSSAPPSEKSSEDEDDKEDEKVCIADWFVCLFAFDCFLKTDFTYVLFHPWPAFFNHNLLFFLMTCLPK